MTIIIMFIVQATVATAICLADRSVIYNPSMFIVEATRENGGERFIGSDHGSIS